MANTSLTISVKFNLRTFVAVSFNGKIRFAVLEGIRGMENVKPILEAIIAGKEGSEDEPKS